MVAVCLLPGLGDLSEKWPSFAQYLGCHSWGAVGEPCAF